MLIIPYQTRFTAKSLPVITLVLVAVNLLVFLLFQSGDRAAYERAADYYFSSSLPQVEFPATPLIWSALTIRVRCRCCERYGPDPAMRTPARCCWRCITTESS